LEFKSLTFDNKNMSSDTGKKIRESEEKVGKESIRRGINVILEQYHLRITPGKDRRYEFRGGYAY
jgi:hypothetical protein